MTGGTERKKLDLCGGGGMCVHALSAKNIIVHVLGHHDEKEYFDHQCKPNGFDIEHARRFMTYLHKARTRESMVNRQHEQLPIFAPRFHS